MQKKNIFPKTHCYKSRRPMHLKRHCVFFLLAWRPRRAYTCVRFTFLHLSDILLASMTIILKHERYYGSRFTWSACSLSIQISNNSSTMNMCLPEKQ